MKTKEFNEIISYTEVEKQLDKVIDQIFTNDDLESLSAYEKRYKIFEYLTRTLEYDMAAYQKIKSTAEGLKRYSRDPWKEFQNAAFNGVGVCNAISQFYKLLLEKVGIKAHCVICGDGTSVFHQLNLVYDDYNDSYSFDDVTSVIVKRGTIEDYFDYDLAFANSINQGNQFVMKDKKYLILREDYVNIVVGRMSAPYNSLKCLPTNIRSIKSIEDNCMV